MPASARSHPRHEAAREQPRRAAACARLPAAPAISGRVCVSFARCSNQVRVVSGVTELCSRRKRTRERGSAGAPTEQRKRSAADLLLLHHGRGAGHQSRDGGGHRAPLGRSAAVLATGARRRLPLARLKACRSRATAPALRGRGPRRKPGGSPPSRRSPISGRRRGRTLDEELRNGARTPCPPPARPDIPRRALQAREAVPHSGRTT